LINFVEPQIAQQSILLKMEEKQSSKLGSKSFASFHWQPIGLNSECVFGSPKLEAMVVSGKYDRQHCL
jgi:hypothetical protein